MKLSNALRCLCLCLYAAITLGLAGCSTLETPPVANLAPSVPVAPAAPTPPAQASPAQSQPAAVAKASKSDLDMMQGSWKGTEVGGEDNAASLVVSGRKMEYHGANPKDWYKGTFTLRENTNPKQCVFEVVECASPDYVGKNGNAIYELEGGVLKIAGNEPGKPEMPTSFDDPEARRFVFKLKE